MKSFVVTIFLVFYIVLSSAQTSTPAIKLSNMSTTDWNNVFSGLQPLVTPGDRKIKGTPFLYEEYLPGSVYLSDSIHSPDRYNFKLNIHTNEIWMQKDAKTAGQEIILTNPRIIALVLTKDGIKHTFKKLPLPFALTTDRKFVEMFYCGSITLIKEIKKVYTGSNFKDQGISVLNSESETDAYETKTFYYLADETGNIQRLRLKLADVFEHFPSLVKSHKSQLENYCKSQNINKNLSEEELTALLNFMSSIRSS